MLGIEAATKNVEDAGSNELFVYRHRDDHGKSEREGI